MPACAGLLIWYMGIGLPQMRVSIVPRIFMRKTEHPEKSPLHDAAVNPKRPSDSGQTRNRAEFNVCSSGDCPSTDRSGKASSAYCGWLGGWLDRLLGDRSGEHRSRHSGRSPFRPGRTGVYRHFRRRGVAADRPAGRLLGAGSADRRGRFVRDAFRPRRPLGRQPVLPTVIVFQAATGCPPTVRAVIAGTGPSASVR